MQQVRGKRSSPVRARGRATAHAPLRTALRAAAHATSDFISTKPRPRPEGLWRQVATGTLTMWPAIGACAAFYAATTLYGAVLAGHFDGGISSAAKVVRTIASVPGFTIGKVQIEGAKPDARAAILKAVGASAGDPILWLDTHKAKLRVEELPSIKSATILRLLPDVIRVQVEERAPYAIWQSEGDLWLIDDEGVVISALKPSSHVNLPLVVGEGANVGARTFLTMLDDYPGLRLQMRAAVRVGDRRWNIRLMNGVDIRLPDDGVAAALRELAALEREHGLFARDIAAIDLRLKDRITIRLGDEAAIARNAALKGGVKPRKKGGET